MNYLYKIQIVFFIFFIRLFFITDVIIGQNDNEINIGRNELDYQDLIKVGSNKLEVISASRSAKKVEDLPVTVFVITRDEILQNRLITLVDVLKYLPGIKVSQPGGGDFGEMFLMRGLRGNYYTKILINNIPIQPSVVSGMPLGAQLPIRQAERIEIIYGPASAVYGADAMAGVINIIIKEPESSAYAQADVDFGRRHFSYINFTAGGKAGKNKNILYYSFYGSKYQFLDMNIYQKKNGVYHPLSYLELTTDSLPLGDSPSNFKMYKLTDINEDILREYSIPADSFIKGIYPPGYEGTTENPFIDKIPQESHNFGLQLRFKGLKFSYMQMYRKDHSSIGLSTFLFKYNNQLNFHAETIQRGALSYDVGVGKLSSSTNISYLRYRQDKYTSRGVTYLQQTGVDQLFNYSASDDLFAEQLFTYTPTKNLEFIGGLYYQFSGNLPTTNDLFKPFDTDSYKSFSTSKLPEDTLFGSWGLNPINFTYSAAFIQVFYTFHKFSFIGGFRFDQNSLYGHSHNPRFAVLYKINENTSLRGSYGSAYKAPSSSITYQSIAMPTDSLDYPIEYAAIPNKDLKPEVFRSFELGLRIDISSQVNIDVSLYHNDIQNLIVTKYINSDSLNNPNSHDKTGIRQNVNSSGAQSRLFGGQLSFNIKDIIPEIRLKTSLTINYAFGDETLPEGKGHLDFFRQMPKYMGNFRISFYPLRKLQLQFDNLLMSSWYRLNIPSEELLKLPYYKVDGYYTLDFLANYQFNKNFSGFMKILNVFDTEYGGIDALGMDIDMHHNPQLGRNIRFGVSYRFE